MPNLVTKVPEQCSVRLVHRDTELLAVYVVPFREIQCDDPVVMTCHHLLLLAGQQVEGQPELGVGVAPRHR